MNLIQKLSVLAVYQTLGDRADSLFRFAGERLGNPARRLESALDTANDRAWRCLEVALAGESWWTACKVLLGPRDEAMLLQQVRTFLASLPPTELPESPEKFHKVCLGELRAARRVGLVPGPKLCIRELAHYIQGFARFDDSKQLIELDRQHIDGIAAVLRKEGFPNLAVYATLRPAQQQPLIVRAVRYFFRREIESDPQLSAGLTRETLEHLSKEQQAGMLALQEALNNHGHHLEELLAEVVDTLTDTHRGVRQVKAGVDRSLEAANEAQEELRYLRSEIERQGKELRQLSQLLLQFLVSTAARPAAPGVPLPELVVSRLAPLLVSVKTPPPGSRRPQLPG